MLVKNNICDLITEVNIDTTKHDDGVFWCLIGSILFGVLYIPPAGSVNLDEEVFDNIQMDIVNIRDSYNIDTVCLLGDFNGRTGSDPDFISYNNHVRQSLDDRACNEILIGNELMDLCNVRSSKDNVVNAQGKRILNLCNSMDLRILNGRFGLDSMKYTCKESSIVDYVMVSQWLMSEVLAFKVEDFDPIISDVHNVLSIRFHCTMLANRLNESDDVDVSSNNIVTHAENNMDMLNSNNMRIKWKTGYLPEKWTVGIIVPIYKNKGKRDDPGNYRGITLLSCISKVFTSLLSQRLSDYVENFQLLGSEQAGFRKNHSTVDHIFVLYALTEIYVKKEKKKLFCAFVDYSKAFDTISRVHLWSKLISHNINGRILNVIRNMYSSAKSFIRNNNVYGQLFNCNIGVRQGENLSPLLFSLYLNDLQEFLSKAYEGLNVASELIERFNQTDDTVLYLKLFALLYADDTIIMAESSHELQAALNGLNHYCNIWKLKVNVSKTKVVIFANRQPKHLPQFRLGNLVIDVTTGYTYLGMYIKCNGNMLEGIMQLKKQASRAMFSLLQKSRKLGLNVDIQMQLFDSLVLPICLYGCEVWGFKHVEIAESLHLQFCKTVLKLNKSTPSCMVLGELGRFKLQYNVDIRMLTYSIGIKLYVAYLQSWLIFFTLYCLK